MTSLIIAKRYAKALLEIGQEDGNLEQYGKELAEMAALLTESPELESVLSNPAFDLESRMKVLEAILAKTDLSPIVSNFFKLLLERGRFAHARAINEVYAKLVDQVRGITRAQVVSAAPLDDARVGEISEALKKVAGSEVTLEIKEDPGLIGGVVARIGDLVLDGSVRRQLEILKDSLKRGEYA